jgi:integrase
MPGLQAVAKIRVNMKGVHRVRKRLSTGQMTEYHYAWRGGPCFWVKSSGILVGSMEYIDAYREALASRVMPGTVKGTFQEVINEFFASSDFAKLGARTQHDHRKNVMHEKGIEAEFGKAPIGAFENKRIRTEVMRWRDTFTEGTGDNMMATMQRIVSFAYERGLIGEHHLLRLMKRAKGNRADIIWTQAEIDLFIKGAPTYVSRILTVAVETGYRPGDLRILQRSHFENRNGKPSRILIKTAKSRGRNFASVPVTERLAAVLRDLPDDQENIIVGANGKPYGNTQKLGQLVSEWRDKLGIRSELRLYDARGTAVTRLIRAGCNLGELAGHMGWSYQHAAAMLERYAALDPEMTDGILEKVQAAEDRQNSRDTNKTE